MGRTTVVTGAASGIGAATAALLESRGERVIGVDLRDTAVTADLSSPAGRQEMADDVSNIAGGSIDALIACAGVLAADPITVRVNYFGAVIGAELLRPMLAEGTAPRAVVVSSAAGMHEVRDDIVAACLAGHEDEACVAAQQAVDDGAGDRIYASSKQAVSRWIRTTAATDAWAGAGVALNGVGPGVVRTPMTTGLLGSRTQREWIDRDVPMPLGGYAVPEQIAEVLIWLASPANSIVTGQIIYADGGADAAVRGDSVW